MKKITNISPYSSQYNDYHAYWLARASRMAYSNPAKVRKFTRRYGLPDAIFINNSETDTQAYVIRDEEFIFVVFRGTKERRDWYTDIQLHRESISYGKAHDGFVDAWNSVRSDVWKAVKSFQSTHKARSLWITGHSLGGALATLAAADRCFRGLPVDGLYTYGSPRVLDFDAARHFEAIMGSRTFRFINNNDLVTRLPTGVRFKHVGKIRYFSDHGLLYEDMSHWFRFKDRLRSARRHIGRKGIDGISDHSIDDYIRLIKIRLNID